MRSGRPGREQGDGRGRGDRVEVGRYMRTIEQRQGHFATALNGDLWQPIALRCCTGESHQWVYRRLDCQSIEWRDKGDRLSRRGCH